MFWVILIVIIVIIVLGVNVTPKSQTQVIESSGSCYKTFGT